MNDDVLEVEFDEEIFLPVYRPLLDCESDIIFLWGGRDSGKSHFIAQCLIKKCMEADYFRCVLIKKTYDSIKDSQWQDIKDQVEEMGLEDLFHFTQNPLQITCVNGNKFIARGCDNPKKIKSIKNPTDAWYEEGDQLTEEEHLIIWSGLRGPTRVQQWFSFNPEAEDVSNPDDFWLCKNWVGKRYNQRVHDRKRVKVGKETVDITFTSWHTTRDDNPYCTAARKAIHENYKDSNPYYYDVYRWGIWGKKDVKSPFAHQFDRIKHTDTEAVYDPQKLVYMSLDFNIDPFTAIFFHKWRDQHGEHCHVFDEIEIKGGSIQKMADQVRIKYGRHLPSLSITGDATGMNKSIEQADNAGLYLQLVRHLGISKRQLQVPANPQHKTSREDVNYFLFHYQDFKINPETCPNTIRDLETVEVDMYGKIKKSDRSKVEQQADFLDNVRYLVNTHFKDWVRRHQK